MWLRRNIPNLLTLLNLLGGCIAIVFVFDGRIGLAAVMILFSAVFDFLDGFAARILHSYSEVGKQLDSLADMVSFGLVPSVMVFQYLSAASPESLPTVAGINVMALPAFLIALMSAVRLAIFNLDESQSDSFKGLPTPANAFMIISIPITLEYGNENYLIHSYLTFLLKNYYYLIFITLVLSSLLVSPFRMLSFKFKNFAFRYNLLRYVFLILSLVLIIFLKISAFPLIMILYLICSVIYHFQYIRHKKNSEVFH